MRAENIRTNPNGRKQLNVILLAMGVMAASASAWVAWPALIHLSEKFI